MDEQKQNIQILQIQEEQADGIHVKDYLFIIIRRWRVIVITFISVMVLAYSYVSKIPVVYEAEAIVKLPASSASGGLSAAIGILLPVGPSGDMATEMEVIQGRDITEKVINDLKYDKKAENANLDRRLIISGLQSKINVLNKGKSNLIEIKAISKNPKEATDIANAYANEYIKISKDTIQNSWDRLISMMGDKLTEAKDELEKSRQLLHDYEAKEKLTPTYSSILLGGGVSATGQNTPADIAQAIAIFKSNIMQTELRLEMLRKNLPEANPEVINLKNQIDENKQRLKEEESKAIERYNKLYGLSDLAAKVMFYQQICSQLVTKHEELKAQYLTQNKSAEIFENAVEPLFPTSSKHLLILIVAPLMGMLLGIGIVLTWNIFDNSIHTPENAKKSLEIPVLGSIPKLILRKKNDWSPLLIYEDINLRNWVRELYRESYMALRMEILSSLEFNGNDANPGKHQGKVLLITSSVPKEGKSIVSTNIATSLANTGMKVLLVEINQRHSSQESLLKLDAKAGLIDLLLKKASWEDVIKCTSISNFSVITAGAKDSQHDLSGLLLSESMNDFMQTAKKRFDFIIFDSTPITLGPESISAGFMIDGVVLVVKSGHTKKDVALKSVQTMRGNNMNVLGAIINYATPNRKYRRYYN